MSLQGGAKRIRYAHDSDTGNSRALLVTITDIISHNLQPQFHRLFGKPATAKV